MTAPAKEFKFEINDAAEVGAGKDWGGFIVSRVRVSNGERLEIFRASTREKADAWLQIYLGLSLPDRRKLRDRTLPAGTVFQPQDGVVGQHTPGPWRHSKRSNISNLIEGPTGVHAHDRDDGYRGIATVQSCTASQKYIEQDANQQANIDLIVAAPEMLDALEEAKAILEIYYQPNDDGSRPTIDRIGAVIAKATGAKA